MFTPCVLHKWEGIPNDKAKMGAGLLPSYRSILSTNIDLFLWSNRRTLFSKKTRGKIEELGNKNKDDFYILEA